MQVRIGTAGYLYRGWVGDFYPPGTRSTDMLPFYAGQFPVVEINSSFYRPPTVEQTAKMTARVPRGFAFTFKAPKSLSHGHSTDDLPAFRRAMDKVAAAGKLLGVLLQVPESFHNTAPNRDWLARTGQELRPHRVAVEFRHRSWAVSNLMEWLEHVGLDVVSVAVPDIPSLFPRGIHITHRRIYVRFHSQNGAAWYAGGAARYHHDFASKELREWASGLKTAAEKNRADECLIFFNNCVTTRAIANARELAGMLKPSPAIEVIDAPRSVRERRLFDD